MNISQEIIDDGENGLLVETGNPELLAEPIEKLMREPHRCRSMSENARETVFMEFTIATMMDRYAKYYRTLVYGGQLNEETNGF